MYKICSHAETCNLAQECPHGTPHLREGKADCSWDVLRTCMRFQSAIACIPAKKSFKLLWKMYRRGFRSAQEQKLTDWYNWTPLQYYLAATYLAFGMACGGGLATIYFLICNYLKIL